MGVELGSAFCINWDFELEMLREEFKEWIHVFCLFWNRGGEGEREGEGSELRGANLSFC